MPAGQPTKYKPEYCDLVIEKMSEGFSQEACAGFIGVATDTLFEWKNVHPEFSDAIREGLAKSRVMWEQMGNSGAMGKIPNFNAVTWIFNMKNRFKWTDRNDVTTNDEKLPAYNNLNDEQLEQVIEAKYRKLRATESVS